MKKVIACLLVLFCLVSVLSSCGTNTEKEIEEKVIEDLRKDYKGVFTVDSMEIDYNHELSVDEADEAYYYVVSGYRDIDLSGKSYHQKYDADYYVIIQAGEVYVSRVTIDLETLF